MSTRRLLVEVVVVRCVVATLMSAVTMPSRTASVVAAAVAKNTTTTTTFPVVGLSEICVSKVPSSSRPITDDRYVMTAVIKSEFVSDAE